jgi:hypothetical protein
MSAQQFLFRSVFAPAARTDSQVNASACIARNATLQAHAVGERSGQPSFLNSHSPHGPGEVPVGGAFPATVLGPGGAVETSRKRRVSEDPGNVNGI